MSLANNKLQLISQSINDELVAEIIRPLNARLKDKSGAYYRCKQNNAESRYLKLTHDRYMSSVESLEKDKECDILAYLGISNRSDYFEQFDNVCEGLEEEGFKVIKQVSYKQSTEANERDVILSKAILLYSKYICKEHNVYNHITEQGIIGKSLCEIELAEIIKPTYVNILIQPKLLLTYASMQPEDNFMINIYNKLDIPTVTLQHGLYVRYDKTETINKINYQIQPAKHFLSWGEYTSKLIQAFHPQTIVHNCGRPHLYKINTHTNEYKNEKIILICLDQKLYQAENLEMVKAVIEMNKCLLTSEYKIKLRLHPQLSSDNYYNIFPELEQYGELSEASIIIGHTTTMLHEAANNGTKTYKFKTSAECVPFPEKYCFTSHKDLLEIVLDPRPYDNSFTKEFFHSIGDNAIKNSVNAIKKIFSANGLKSDELKAIQYEVSTNNSEIKILKNVPGNNARRFVIATTVYNDTTYIEETIDSILGQLGNYEICYVIKDASDGFKSSVAIGKILSRKLSLITSSESSITIVYTHSRDNGMYEGLLHAFSTIECEPRSNDIFGYLNADDILELDAFEKADFAFSNKNCKLLLARSTVLIKKNNEEAKKKIDEAHVYAAKAGGEGQLFFNAITAIFGSGSFEDAAAAAEVASRTKGNLAYFYQALKKIREAKNINLEPETQEEFGDAESIVEI